MFLKNAFFVRPYYSFFFVLSHGGTKFDYTTTNANDPCLETYWGKTKNNICKALSFLETMIFKNGHFKVFFSRCKQASSLFRKKITPEIGQHGGVIYLCFGDWTSPRSILQCYDYFLFNEEDCGKMLSKDRNNFFSMQTRSLCASYSFTVNGLHKAH